MREPDAHPVGAGSTPGRAPVRNSAGSVYHWRQGSSNKKQDNILMTGIIRLLIFGLLIWLAWKLLRRLLTPPPSSPTSDTTRMLRCEACGVHVPEAEAFIARGHTFCSQAHQQQWLEKHDH